MNTQIYSPIILIQNDSPQSIIVNDNKTFYFNLKNINLSNVNLWLEMSILTSTTPKSGWPAPISGACQITNPTNGNAFISLTSNDTSIAGTYQCKLFTTDANNSYLQSILIFNLEILPPKT